MKTKRKNIFLTIGFAAMAIALAICSLFSFNLATSAVAEATFVDQKVGSDVLIQDNAFYMTYAGDTLVAIDKDGYVYTSEDGTAANLTKNGNQLDISISDQVTSYISRTNPDLLAYKNGTLVFSGYNGTKERIYYSTNNGRTWNIASTNFSMIPVSVVVGNNMFAILMQDASENQKLYKSFDGITWTLASDVTSSTHFFDNFTFVNGSFTLTKYPKSVFQNGTKIYINYSSDLTNWTTIEAPVEAVIENNSAVIPYIFPFYYNNAIYIQGNFETIDGQSNTYKYFYKTENFQTWTKTQNYWIPYSKVSAYQDGLIFGTNTSICYIEFLSDNQKTADAILFFIQPNGAYYGDTIAFSENHLTVGFSGLSRLYGSDNNAFFATYERPETLYTVRFLDWNGTVLSTSQVVDGQTVTDPGFTPTRTGYTFAGWDTDLTEPITENKDITATYTINQYTVLFLDYDGRQLESLTVPYGGTVTQSDIPTPERANYQFTGWDKDTTQTITGDITFYAQYTATARLNIVYPGVVGVKGIDGQLKRTGTVTQTFEYTIGDNVRTTNFNTWYDSTILPWINDFDDGYYDYDKKFAGWSAEIPTTISQDVTITAQSSDLVLVSLNYYSQLRFDIQDDYYYCFVGYMTVERLVQPGYVINLEYFKRPDVNYDVYNANRSAFYNNLFHFSFNGWDKDITEPITEDTAIKGQYTLPSVHMRMFDADKYLFKETDQTITFLTIEDLLQIVQDNTASTAVERLREVLRNFFLFRWGELVSELADQIDFGTYFTKVERFHSMSTQILMGFVQLDTDNPDIYAGVFKNGSVDVTGSCLNYYSGTPEANNLTYFIGAECFSTEISSLSVTVTYGTRLDSAIKTLGKIWEVIKNVFSAIWAFIMKYWIWIVILILLIVFRKPIIAAFKAIIAAAKRRAAERRKKSKYKQAEKQLDNAQKEYKSGKSSASSKPKYKRSKKYYGKKKN